VAAILERGDIIPDFTLCNHSGDSISSRSFYMRRILVLVLLPDTLSPDWAEWLTDLAAEMRTVSDDDAVLLVILPGKVQEAARNLQSSDMGMHCLIDEDGAVRRRFGDTPLVGQLLVTNRNGVVYHVVSGKPGEPGFAPDEVPGWVEFVACQCS
jgi:peroxiredoxin